MNYTMLFRKGDILLCECGQTTTVQQRGILPAGWIVKQVTLIPDVCKQQPVCPACDKAELERLNP